MRLILLIAALYIVAVPGTAAAASQQDGKMVLVANLTADQYLREQIDKVFVRLGDHALSADERAERFRTLVTEIFDVQFISRFVLGPYWRQADDAEKRRFSSLLIELQVTRWAQRFKPSKDQGAIDISNPRTDESGHFIVPMTLRRTGSDDEGVRLLWRLRSKDDSFKVFDVMVEGTSMLIAQKSEYQSFMRRNGGVQALNEEISGQIAKLKAEN